MPFTSYAELVTTIQDWLNRDDLDSQVPDFIRLCEARLQRDLRLFTTRLTDFAFPVDATTGKTSAIAGGGLTPAEISDVGWMVHGAASPIAQALPQVSLKQLRDWYITQPTSGPPRAYALTGQTLTVYPTPDVPKDAAGADSFYKLVVSMIGPTASHALPINAANFSFNPIITEHPDLYLYGALCEAAPYLSHDERLPVWQARFEQVKQEIRRQDEALAFGGRDQRIQLPVVFG